MFIDVSKEEFETLKTEAVRNGWGWPAALSTNHWREVWPPTGWGYTPVDDRRRLHGRFLFVGQIVDAYLERRPEGGRFFVGDDIVFYKLDEDGNPCYALALFRKGAGPS